MKVFIKHRDGPARNGNVSYGKYAFSVPNLFYIQTKKNSVPPYAELVSSKEVKKDEHPTLLLQESIFFNHDTTADADFVVDNQLIFPPLLPNEAYEFAHDQSKNKNCEVIAPDLNLIKTYDFEKKSGLLILSHGYQLLNHQHECITIMSHIKQSLPTNVLLYLPGVATPSNLSLLNYIGVDICDNCYAEMAAVNRVLLYPEGAFLQNDLSKTPCFCSSCQGRIIMDLSIEQIKSHNDIVLFAELHKVRNAIDNGRLRELVEIRVRASPQLAALLHLLDKQAYDFIENNTPIVREISLKATTHDALWRPEVQRFQQRILTRYRKPEQKKILLLLPCSAKKPYSLSQTHRVITKTKQKVKNNSIIHDVIITSPLGIVPRELENIYPASSYDIGVTGFWNKDEEEIIRGLLRNYIANNYYDHVVVHTPLSINAFILDLLPDYYISVRDTPTSKQSLDNLKVVLNRLCCKYQPIFSSQTKWEAMLNIASYQFGCDIADLLLKDAVVKGRWPQYKILRRSQQLGMTTSPRGLISLTLQGAKILSEANQFWVKIDTSFQLKGSVFAPAILKADPQIRIGDEVYVIQGDNIQGVGIAQMSGTEMVRALNGESVKIRHHVDT